MAPKKTLSVVVPTYKESLNVKPLCVRLFKATRAAGLEVELLLLDDDSGKDTEDTLKIVAELKKEDYNVRAHVRRRGEGKGLSSAVVLGIEKAKYPVVLCMDADLQHEPESVPAVAAPVLEDRADFSVGSRNVGGGDVSENWPLVRRIISWGATTLARPLTPCTDPMSGFFCLSRETFERGQRVGLNPMGYKIGLELMVRCKCRNIVDVPINFCERVAGESKLTMKQNFLYVGHLVHLYWFKFPVGFLCVVLLVAFVGIAALLLFQRAALGLLS